MNQLNTIYIKYYYAFHTTIGTASFAGQSAVVDAPIVEAPDNISDMFEIIIS